MNSKQARTARRIDPHAQCRYDYNLVNNWLRSSRKDNDLLEEANWLLRKEIYLLRTAAVSVAVAGLVLYIIWLFN